MTRLHLFYSPLDFYLWAGVALVFAAVSYYFLVRMAVRVGTFKAYGIAFAHCMFPFAFYGVASAPELRYLTVGFLVLLPLWGMALYKCIGNEFAGNPPKWMLPSSNDDKQK